MTAEEVKAKYEARILLILEGIKAALLDHAETKHTVEGPFEMHCDDFRWSMRVDVDEDNEHGYDIDFIICESGAYGDDDEGITFQIQCIEVGGRIVGLFSPFNYTPLVWVHEDEDIEERFQIFEQPDPQGMVELIEDDQRRPHAVQD